jgi:hypothetical protein
MKKIIGLALIAFLGLSAPAFSQDSKAKKGVKKAWHGTKRAGKSVGNKTAEVASKGASRVADKKSDEWIGPRGQTIYIDDVNRFYWVNGRGKKIYVSESALKARDSQ